MTMRRRNGRCARSAVISREALSFRAKREILVLRAAHTLAFTPISARSETSCSHSREAETAARSASALHGQISRALAHSRNGSEAANDVRASAVISREALSLARTDCARSAVISREARNLSLARGAHTLPPFTARFLGRWRALEMTMRRRNGRCARSAVISREARNLSLARGAHTLPPFTARFLGRWRALEMTMRPRNGQCARSAQACHSESKLDQRKDVVIAQPLAPFEKCQLNHKGQFGHLPTCHLDQIASRRNGTARRQ